MSDGFPQFQVVLQGILQGSPAEKAGMKLGDIILSVNGIATHSWTDYLEATQNRGTEQRMDVLRNGKLIEVVLPISADTKPVDYYAIAAELENTSSAKDSIVSN
jgi:S1-C subfamily serine protease